MAVRVGMAAFLQNEHMEPHSTSRDRNPSSYWFKRKRKHIDFYKYTGSWLLGSLGPGTRLDSGLLSCQLRSDHGKGEPSVDSAPAEEGGACLLVIPAHPRAYSLTLTGHVSVSEPVLVSRG